MVRLLRSVPRPLTPRRPCTLGRAVARPRPSHLTARSPPGTSGTAGRAETARDACAMFVVAPMAPPVETDQPPRERPPDANRERFGLGTLTLLLAGLAAA